MNKHYIPHPLCHCSDKELKSWLEEFVKSPETLSEYVKHSGNPKWAASHLVRAVAQGLFKSAVAQKAAMALNELANELAQTDRKELPLEDDRVL